MKNLLIIDGHNFLWRSYSVPYKFYSNNGTPLHVVTTYLSQVKKALSALEGCTHIVVVFDTPTPNSNTALSKDYKANRKKDFSKDEDSPFDHLPYIEKALSFIGITKLMIPYHEADDVMATVATKFASMKSTHKSFVSSTDTDFYQLVSSKIKILRLRSGGEFNLIDKDYLKQNLGISPKKYVTYKALMGDKADNIAGIRGIGPITSRKIVTREIQFDLTAYKELLDLNHKLIKFNCEVPVEIDFDNLEINPEVINKKTYDIFEECCF